MYGIFRKVRVGIFENKRTFTKIEILNTVGDIDYIDTRINLQYLTF